MKRSRWNLHLITAFHADHRHASLPSVTDREIGRTSGFERKRRNIKKSANDVGGASRGVILLMLAFAGLSIFFLAHALAPFIVNLNMPFPVALPFFTMFENAAGTESFGIEVSFKPVMYRKEKIDRAR